MVDILYKCRCMKAEKKIVVTDRVPGSDVADWMNNVVASSVSYHHRYTKSALCMAGSVEYIKMAINEDGSELGTVLAKN